MKTLHVCAISLLIAASAFARIINVPADYSTIQAGIDASVNGDTVLVAPGEYIENPLVDGKNILLTSAQGPQATIIRGYPHLLGNIDTTCVFRGFTVHKNINWPRYETASLVWISSGTPKIEGNIIEGNDCAQIGAGINCGYYPAYGSPIIRGNIIRNNFTVLEGAGILARDSTVIEGNIISNNRAGYTACETGDAGGIWIASAGVIRFNVIAGNEAFRYLCDASGGGIRKSIASNLQIYNNTIVNNSARRGDEDGLGGGILFISRRGDSGVIVENNIIAFNPYGGGVNGNMPDSADIRWDYNLVFGNGGGDYIGLPPGPHDIQADPLFEDRFSGDYHLLSNSPCIDAGDPDSPFDPDGTRADIGAYYFDQGVGIDDPGPSGPYLFALRQNYPNPFNGQTIISYYLDKESTVSLFIFSITGHSVLPLVNKELQQAGEHNYTWDGRDFRGQPVSTGIYFYELYVNDSRESKAMIMIK